MSASANLIDALKHSLKAQGLTYAKVARGLGMSEASVKRMFSRRDFTLKRLDKVLDLAGLELGELTRLVTSEAKLVSRLTPQQERTIVSDKKLMLLALCALNQMPIEKIISSYQLSEPECIRMLVRLDRLGIIRLLPGNRYRLLLSRTFSWLPDGPMQQYFKAQAQADYFRSRFDGADELMLFVTGRLGKSSREAILSRLRKAAAEFAQMHNDDGGQPLKDRIGVSMLVAIRPWQLSAFGELRRRK
jgi:transcriptional regulator with XRE-family HTH domain